MSVGALFSAGEETSETDQSSEAGLQPGLGFALVVAHAVAGDRPSIGVTHVWCCSTLRAGRVCYCRFGRDAAQSLPMK